MKTQLGTLFCLASLVSACDPDAGGKDSGTGTDDTDQSEAMAACVAVSSTPLADDEVSALGFSPAEVLGFSAGERVVPLTWAKDGSVTDLTLTVTATGPGALVHYEVESTGTGPVAEIGCADQVEVPVSVGFVTADGAFAEQWSLTLTAAMAGEASLWQPLALDALSGSYTVTEVDPSAYDAVSAYFAARFSATAPASGEISGQAEDNGDPSDPDGVASATAFDIATW